MRAERIYVAGHRGLVGRALVRALESRGLTPIVRSRAELDLRDAKAVAVFFAAERPTVVLDAAAKVGGIEANRTKPADFLYDNLTIQTNLLHAAHAHGTRRFVFLGSSCIYPKYAPQPIREDALLTGPLEPTNEAYAIAKIAGIKLAQALRRQHGFDAFSLMPTNLYGPFDNFDPSSSHVLAALVRRFVEAKDARRDRVVLWGTGTPRREFLHVDDLATACLRLLELEHVPDVINVGFGSDVTILELAQRIAKAVGFEGAIETDPSMPDGTPRKLLDSSTLRSLGWAPSIGLDEGIPQVVAWFRECIQTGTVH